MSSSIPLPTTSLPLRTSFPKIPNTSANPNSPSSKDPLDATYDARQIVRLIQCSQCSLPLREPNTLPCGNSLCKDCIPPLHDRPYISYPATANRLQGFTCPFIECGRDHALGDCSVDVVLNKVMDIVRKEIDIHKKAQEATRHIVTLEEKGQWPISGVPSLQEQPLPQVFRGGRLAATFDMAEKGDLAYNSEIGYTDVYPMDNSEFLDIALLAKLKEAARSELDCPVCYALFLDPLTASCGHTLCRTCIHRVQDHGDSCPSCRRCLGLPPGVKASQAPSNIRITNLLSGLCPEALVARQEAAMQEDSTGVGELDTPLFICTLSFPSTPTFLHIFEPRYKLMIRRAAQSNGKFGMLLHNPSREPQGDLGPTPFYQYGTMLSIVNMHVMPDGRSIIETTGVSRFRVLAYGELSGYTVGKVERVDDMNICEEEAIEAAETSSATKPPRFHFQELLEWSPSAADMPTISDLACLSTQELMQVAGAYVNKMRDSSAPWLRENIVQAYGACPSDPAIFPWWFASVVPTNDKEKYKMLQTNSVRHRLMMCVVFALELERQRWYASLSSPLSSPDFIPPMTPLGSP